MDTPTGTTTSPTDNTPTSNLTTEQESDRYFGIREDNVLKGFANARKAKQQPGWKDWTLEQTLNFVMSQNP
jgi:hypothetical protein